MSTISRATLRVSCCWTSWAKTLSRLASCERGLEFGGWRVGKDFALGDDDDAVADQLDDFEHVRDVEDGLALRGELLQQVFEEPGGDDVEAGERFVEDEQLGIVQQGGGDEDALLHALGVERDGRVAPGLEVEQSEQACWP